MYNKNMNKGKICTIKDMDWSNKKRNHRQCEDDPFAVTLHWNLNSWGHETFLPSWHSPWRWQRMALKDSKQWILCKMMICTASLRNIHNKQLKGYQSTTEEKKDKQPWPLPLNNQGPLSTTLQTLEVQNFLHLSSCST